MKINNNNNNDNDDGDGDDIYLYKNIQFSKGQSQKKTEIAENWIKHKRREAKKTMQVNNL